MKKAFQEQLKNTREALDGNIKSIRSLLESSNNMSELISELQKEAEANEELIKKLTEMRKSIVMSIDELLKNTNELFDAYEEMISTL